LTPFLVLPFDTVKIPRDIRSRRVTSALAVAAAVTALVAAVPAGPSVAIAPAALPVVALAPAVAPGVASAGPRSGRPETAGWLMSGRRVAFDHSRGLGMPAPPGVFEVYTSALSARALLFARDTLWIGTEGGLFFSPAGMDTVLQAGGPRFTAVRTIAMDDGGDLWVGGDGGVSIRRSRGWEHRTRRDRPFFSDITDIRPGERKMWISTWGAGCGYVEGDSLTVITRADSLLDDRVTCVAEENGHTIWIGTESGVCRADSFSWRSLRYGSRLPVGRVRDLAFDEEGGLFVAVARQGVARYSLGRVSVYGPVQGLPSLEIMRFGTDATGRILAAGEGGVSVWDGSGWTPVQSLHEVPWPRTVLAVAHDIEGDTFLGTGDGRCIVLSRDGASQIEIPQRFPESVIDAAAADEKGIWFCGVSNLYRLAGTLERYSLPGEWFDGTVSGIVPEPGGVWLATRFGILHYRGGAWEVFDRRQGLPTEDFTAAAAGRGPDIWFATFDRGVLRLGAEGWVHYTKRHGLPTEEIASLRVDGNGSPWIATRNGQVARFRDDAWEVLDLPVGHGRAEPAGADTSSADPTIRYLDRPGERGSRRVPVILGSDTAGRVLIAAGGELLFQEADEWRAVDLPPGGVAGQVTCCARTADGSLWVGTQDDGIYVLGGERWLHADDGSGLGGRAVSQILIDRAGAVWICTRGGGMTRYTAAVR
jgi:ligand-binding sensor domain-containing protein